MNCIQYEGLNDESYCFDMDHRVLFDNVDVRKLSLHELRREIALVPLNVPISKIVVLLKKLAR